MDPDVVLRRQQTYIQNGNVRTGPSYFRTVCRFFWNTVNSIGNFFYTMVSEDATARYTRQIQSNVHGSNSSASRHTRGSAKKDMGGFGRNDKSFKCDTNVPSGGG